MSLRIARNELLCTLRDGRFRAAAVLVLVVVLAAVAALSAERAAAAEERAQAQSRVRELWLGQDPTNPHSAAHYGTYAFKPVTRLSAFDSGIDPYTGVVAYLEAHRRNEFAHRPARDSGSLARLGETGPAFLLFVLLPLLAVFLGNGAVARAREGGILAFSLAQGARPRAWLLGTWGGISAALMALSIPAVLACFAWSSRVEGVESWAESAARAGALLLAISVFLLTVTALSVALTARARDTRAALVGLLVLWALGTLVLPRAASELGSVLYESPTSQEVHARARELYQDGVDGHDPRNERTQRRKAEILAEYGVQHEDDLPIVIGGVLMQDGEEYQARAYAQVFDELWQGWRAQNRLRDLAAVAWPFAALRRVSMSLAGTDLEHHLDFAAAAEEYRGMLVAAMNGAIAANKRPKGESYEAGRELWESVPDFDYVAPDLGFALRGAARGWIGLAAWALAAAALLLLPWRPRLP